MPSFSPISSDLHRECFQLFPDAMFADLFDGAGRRSVPPRPKVERKIGHLMRRRHGGRRARVRGQLKVAADFALLAAAVNLARLGILGAAHRNGAWAADGG